MKRTILYIVILLALLGLTYHFSGQGSGKSSNIDTSDRDFAIENTDRVGKIFIATRDGDPVLLSLKGNEWYVNDKYLASSSSVDEILRILRDIEVRYIPPRSSYTNIVQTIGSLGIKVEVYDKRENLMRSFYIGGVTNDEKGTHFLMEGAEQPYVMHLPYWQGSLRTSFTLEEDHWRDRAIFNERIRDIQKVELRYPNQMDESFVVERMDETSWDVRPLDPDMPRITRRMHPGMIETYLRNFQRVGIEGFENDYYLRDSIERSTPYCEITLTRTDGKVKTYKLFQRYPDLLPGPFAAAQADASEFQLRFFLSSPDDDFMVAQYLVLRDILWGYSWFFRQSEDSYLG